MRVLSIDVGIKNLAYCLFVVEGSGIKASQGVAQWVSQWGVVNIAVSEEETTAAKHDCPKCTFINKSQSKKLRTPILCGKVAKWQASNEEGNAMLRCHTHAKKEVLMIPPDDLNERAINKYTVTQLYDLAKKYQVELPPLAIATSKNGKPKTIKKPALVALMLNYARTACFQPILSTATAMTRGGAAKVDLISVGRNIKIHFDRLFGHLREGDLDYVVIENQISPIAARMKTIQGMIAQYFIMTGQTRDIKYVSSSRKLQVDGGALSPTSTSTSTTSRSVTPVEDDIDDLNDDGFAMGSVGSDQTTYADRKRTGIELCREILARDDKDGLWTDFMATYKKKDDLADCFLQGYWFIVNRASSRH